MAGGTRGAGRGIATELGTAGATVYITGRTTRTEASECARPETIEETAELVNEAGGVGIAVRVDHLVSEQVQALVKRMRRPCQRYLGWGVFDQVEHTHLAAVLRKRIQDFCTYNV